MDIDVIGSYNTLKATLPYLRESGDKHKMDNKTSKGLGDCSGSRTDFV